MNSGWHKLESIRMQVSVEQQIHRKSCRNLNSIRVSEVVYGVDVGESIGYVNPFGFSLIHLKFPFSNEMTGSLV